MINYSILFVTSAIIAVMDTCLFYKTNYEECSYNIGIPTYPTTLAGTLFTRDPKLPKPSSEFRLNGTYQKLSFPTFPIGSHVPKIVAMVTWTVTYLNPDFTRLC